MNKKAYTQQLQEEQLQDAEAMLLFHKNGDCNSECCEYCYYENLVPPPAKEKTK